MKTVELSVEAAFDAQKVEAGFDDIGAAAKGMAGDVEAAARDVDASASKMGSVTDAADNMGSSATKAAGGLGDLSGALAEAPGPLGELGAGMGAAQPLIMGVAGATDLLTLATNSSIVTTVRQKVAQAASAVSTKALAAASKAYTAVQWALNAALNANPIGLVVIAVAALVAGVVLAYKKSETFRDVVNTAFGLAEKAVNKVVDVVGDLVDPIVDVVKKVPDLSGAFSLAKTLIVGYFEAITLPIRTVLDLVEKVIDKIGDIKDLVAKLPDTPLPGPFRAAAGYAGGAAGGQPFTHVPTTVNVNGGYVGNQRQLAVVVAQAVAAELRRRGIK